jgi:hypothetical protein
MYATRRIDFENQARSSRPVAVQVPAIPFCWEKKYLLDAFVKAIHEVSAAQSAQLAAVARGCSSFCDYEEWINFAREKKDLAKYAYLAHVQEHGCHEGTQDHAVNAS